MRSYLRLMAVGASAALALVLSACGGPPVPITGTIKDAYTGAPVAAANLTLGSETIKTGTDGSYQLARWNKSDTLVVSANGYEPIDLALANKPQLEKPQAPTVTLETIAIRPNTLSGLLTDSYSGKPLPGVLVKASDTISATTGPDGRYTLSGLPETFVVTTSQANYDLLTQQLSRTTAMDVALRPAWLDGAVTDRYSGKPVAGAKVSAGSATGTTGTDGRYRLTGVPEAATVTIAAAGYAQLSQPLEKTTSLDAVLRPDTLNGTLIDAKSGKPVVNATVIATTTADGSDVAFSRIDNSADGTFSLEGIPEQGFVQVLAPGYKKQVLPIAPGKLPAEIKLEPFTVRGLYVTAAVASNPRLLNIYFDAIDKTELNSIVIDLKSDLRDDLGLVYYDSQTPLVKELKTSRSNMDLPAILAEAKRRGIYTIARVHIFSHDNVLADAKPEWAAQDAVNGGIFNDYPAPGIHYSWLDPWNQNVWEYNIQLATEAASLGFDEINYDYVRFPSLEFSADDKNRLKLSRTSTPEERYANIAELLKRSQRAINGSGAFLSIDVFGNTAFRPVPLIGQNIKLLSQYTDYIMPMVYPSHFTPGDLGFDNPAQHPGEVIAQSIAAGVKQVEGNRALIRPWLQDFTLIWVPKSLLVEYTPEMVRAQIDAVEAFDGKKDGWILYNSANIYQDAALKPQEP